VGDDDCGDADDDDDGDDVGCDDVNDGDSDDNIYGGVDGADVANKRTAGRFRKGYWARDSNAVPFPRPLLLLACIIHEVLFSDDFFERETKRDYWRKELELKG